MSTERSLTYSKSLIFKARDVFTMLDIPASMDEKEKLDDACETWGPERPRTTFEQETAAGTSYDEGDADEMDNSDGVSLTGMCMRIWENFVFECEEYVPEYNWEWELNKKKIDWSQEKMRTVGERERMTREEMRFLRLSEGNRKS
jgi:hypothetical protein